MTTTDLLAFSRASAMARGMICRTPEICSDNQKSLKGSNHFVICILQILYFGEALNEIVVSR